MIFDRIRELFAQEHILIKDGCKYTIFREIEGDKSRGIEMVFLMVFSTRFLTVKTGDFDGIRELVVQEG